MVKAAAGAVLFVLVFVTVHLFDVWLQQQRRNSRIAHRVAQIVQSDRDTAPPIIILGDSIVEIANVATLCGRDATNAGIAGATISEIEAASQPILLGRRPELVIVAAGVNDAHADRPTPFDRFSAAYRRLIERARASGAVVVSMNIGPVARANPIFDPARIQALNRRIATFGVPVIDLWSAMRAPGQQSLPPSFTDDATHPNATGYVPWKSMLARACDIWQGRHRTTHNRDHMIAGPRST